MMKIIVASLMFAGMVLCDANGQTSYNDVAVIVNTNSAASQTIGSYFKTRRNIDAANMIYVNVDTTEEIDSTMFNLLRSQIENHLVLNNLRDSINYLVTTKGVPLKVNRGSTFSTTSPSSSVESELMLILGSYSQYIGQSSAQISPYFYQNAHFSRTTYGIYLVTRLDAYSVQAVFDLIDRSGANLVVTDTDPFVFDQDPARVSSLNTYLASARTILTGRGKAVIFDSTTTYLTNNQNLLGYVSWGSNDNYQHLYTQYAIPHNTYVNGAIGETFVSTSGRSFADPPNYGQSLIADLIAEGITGIKGYVYEPFSNAMARPQVLFDRYTSGYNLAESYFMASYLVSWMDVVIGDPKTSIVFGEAPNPIVLASFSGSVLQSSNAIEFEWKTISETNNYGFYVQRAEEQAGPFSDLPNSFIAGHGTTVTPQDYSWTYFNAPRGTAYYRLRQVDLDGTIHYSDPIVVTNDILATASAPQLARKFELAQNYPNPFNPTTSIRFSIHTSDHVSLKIYDLTGKEVATLVNASLDAGNHQRTFDATGLAAGSYFYRLQSNNKTEIKKLMLLK